MEQKSKEEKNTRHVRKISVASWNFLFEYVLVCVCVCMHKQVCFFQ